MYCRVLLLLVSIWSVIEITITVSLSEYQLFVLPNKLNHQRAINFCKQLGMNLIKIEDEETNQIVYNFAVVRKLGQYWMDASDKNSEGNWIYNNSKKLVYSKWNPGQPDNWGGNEHCLQGSHFENGFWNDHQCTLNNAVICYYDKLESDGPVSYEEHQLLALPIKANHQEAIFFCKEQGMNLVKVQDDKTNQMVYNFAVLRGLGQYWMDGNDKHFEGNWVYENGKRITYSKWQPGQPDNWGNSEHCLHAGYFQNGFWNDFNCNVNNAIICYRDKPLTNLVDFEENQLVVLPNKVNHQEAVNLCRKQGMSLVKVQSEKTNQIVYNFSVQKKLGQYWMDANDRDSEADWEYEDNKRIVYSKWNPGQPDNWGSNEHCLHGGYFQNGFWNDINCNVNNAVICYNGTSSSETESEKKPDSGTDSGSETVSIYLTDEKTSYNEAVEYCKSQDLKLMRMDNEGMNKIVFNMAKRKKLESYWIDGSDKEQSGKWVLSDGSPLKYKNFRSGESQEGHCINVTPSEGKTWNIVNCDSKNTVICF